MCCQSISGTLSRTSTDLEARLIAIARRWPYTDVTQPSGCYP